MCSDANLFDDLAISVSAQHRCFQAQPTILDDILKISVAKHGDSK